MRFSIVDRSAPLGIVESPGFRGETNPFWQPAPCGCAELPSGTGSKIRGAGWSSTVRGLAEIVAADWLVEWARVARHGGYAGPACRQSGTLGVDEGAQDRQGQIGVTGFDRSIEPVGQFAFARQRAIPRALAIGDAADLP